MMKKNYIFIICIFIGVGIITLFYNFLVYEKWYAKIRFINQLSCYDFPPENNGWKKMEWPLYGSKETGSVFDPFVYMEDSIFVMIVSERTNNTIIQLKSSDGLIWDSYITLLEPVHGSWEHLVNRATVCKKDSIYHMWYTGQSPSVSKIGHATSSDGKLFIRDSINPVLIPSLKEEGKSVMNPCVIYNEKKGCFQMWYAAGDNYEPDALFYAESKDGTAWKKREDPILTKYSAHKWEKAKVGGCDVKLFKDGTYIMYYIGYQNEDVARVCYATSIDGITWERSDSNLILAPTKNGWDSDAIYKPSYIEFNNKAYLYYNGRNGRLERIGLATKVL